MKRGMVVWFCAMLGCATGVASATDAKKTAEASMLVTGTVEVNPDGTVHGYTVDQPAKLPVPVVAVIEKNVPRWTFKLSSAAAGTITTRMSLRIRARPVEGDNYDITIQGASFGDGGGKDGETVSFKTRNPPRYPPEAVKARASGTVYLLIRVGRDGTVQEAIAEQVNLEQYGSKGQMNFYRRLLAEAALDATKTWTYNPPTRGKDVDAPYWLARVPVQFDLRSRGSNEELHPYGRWDVYIPGPRQQAPWVTNQILLSEAPDAVPDGGLHSLDSGLRLSTALDGG